MKKEMEKGIGRESNREKVKKREREKKTISPLGASWTFMEWRIEKRVWILFTAYKLIEWNGILKMVA